MISEILIFSVLSLLSYSLYIASKQKPVFENGSTILKLPSFYYLLGLLMIFFGIGLIIYIYFFTNKIEKTYGILFSLIGIIPGTFIFAKGFISNIVFNESGVVETTLSGKKIDIKWSEIKNVSFSKMSQQLCLKSFDKTIKAHVHLVGFDALVEKTEEKTGKKIKKFIELNMIKNF